LNDIDDAAPAEVVAVKEKPWEFRDWQLLMSHLQDLWYAKGKKFKSELEVVQKALDQAHAV